MTHNMNIPTFDEYFVSEKTGFMLEEPLDELPSYFEAWNKLGKSAATLMEQHKLRDAVHQMPLLETGRLTSHRERRLAYMLLSFIGNGYVWQEGDAGVARIVPRQLAVPWCSIAESLGVKPALSHPSVCLSNWKIVEPSRDRETICWKDLETICPLPGDEHAKLFILLTAQVEFDAVPGLKGILRCMHCVVVSDEEGMAAALEDIISSLVDMTSSLSCLSEEVDPNVFYKQIRPMLSGWGGAESPLPEGLLYEGVSSQPSQVIGASAAQSSTLQCFDAALGIVHQPGEQAFLDKVRQYMMPRHRAFIEALSQAPSIREWVKTSNNEALKSVYTQCVDAVRAFRSYHIQIVAKFVVAMSHKWKQDDQYEAVSKKGTGGQTLMPFLKTLRNTTSEYSLKE